MELFLLRHGLAVERGTPGFVNDADRPLTPAGRRKLRDIAAAMRAMDLTFNQIFSSPILRAKVTAEIVASEMKLARRLTCADELQPGGAAENLIRRIALLRPRPKRVLLVGHEPDLSELGSLLVTGTATAGLAFKKGGLAKLAVEHLHAGKCATLVWLLTPKQMKMMI
jgi:phosphohistidine phosphatase